VLTSPRDKRPLGCEDGFVAANGDLVENCRAQVPVDASRPNNTEGFKSMRPLNLRTHFVALLTLRVCQLLPAGRRDSGMGQKRQNGKKASYHGGQLLQIPV
jgi:hypothetical protein